MSLRHSSCSWLTMLATNADNATPVAFPRVLSINSLDNVNLIEPIRVGYRWRLYRQFRPPTRNVGGKLDHVALQSSLVPRDSTNRQQPSDGLCILYSRRLSVRAGIGAMGRCHSSGLPHAHSASVAGYAKTSLHSARMR
jgi:hypothetical protein